MKAQEESKKHEAREAAFLKDIKTCRKTLGRKRTIQPARDDRREEAPWRPGVRK